MPEYLVHYYGGRKIRVKAENFAEARVKAQQAYQKETGKTAPVPKVTEKV